MGKTQLALEYAYQFRARYKAVFWVRAETWDILYIDFQALAGILALTETDQNPQQVIQTVKHWLSNHSEWLLIFDNIESLQVVHEFLPTGEAGHILLTTRLQSLGTLAQQVAVEPLPLEEATLLLLRRAKHLAQHASLQDASLADQIAARAIAEILGGLPLALDQAGAYIEETGCSLATYLEIYHTHRQELLYHRGQEPSEHPESVATTWSLNFRQIEQANPAAAEFLRICAFLEPDAIPEELISEGEEILGPAFRDLTTDPLKLNTAIKELRLFSLVQRDAEARFLRIHRLVQAVLKDSMEVTVQQQWAERAIKLIHALFPEEVWEPLNWPRCHRYIPQAQACSGLIRDAAFVFVEAAELLSRTAEY